LATFGDGFNNVRRKECKAQHSPYVMLTRAARCSGLIVFSSTNVAAAGAVTNIA
jgi:hypothetical protein